ncbi:MAG: hypothetical protein ACOZAA_03940, partial [Pseudomonadota bacterium]
RENRERLYKAAASYIENTKIGEFEKYRRPFTRQVMSDFRLLYPVLTPFFDHADRAEKDAVQVATAMRCVTFLLFTFYLLAVIFIINLLDGKSASLTSPAFEKAWPLFLPLIIPIITGLTRGSQLDKVRRASSDFGSEFNAHLSLLNNKANFALERVSDDAPTSEGCDERAEQWTATALWLFSLHELYDRYVTTISWRVQTKFVYITWFFRVLKWWLLALFVTALFSFSRPEFGWTIPVILAFSMYAASLFVWDIRPGGGASNDLFAESFIMSVAGRSKEEVSQNHFMTKTARLVKKLRELYYNSID